MHKQITNQCRCLGLRKDQYHYYPRIWMIVASNDFARMVLEPLTSRDDMLKLRNSDKSNIAWYWNSSERKYQTFYVRYILGLLQKCRVFNIRMLQSLLAHRAKTHQGWDLVRPLPYLTAASELNIAFTSNWSSLFSTN